MRKSIVAGNWKMNASKASAEALMLAIRDGVGDIDADQCILFPPAVFFAQAQDLLIDSPIAWGAQTLSEYEAGAYTGEISAAMLVDFGCRYVLVGHSERRQIYAESSATAAKKFAQAQRHHLKPILCVGETQAQRERGETQAVVKAQLDAILQLETGVNALQDAIIAYEPVWAIGTGLSATPQQAQDVHVYLRECVAAHNADIAANLTILYGGSVKPDNAAELFARPDIDGGLIGGAALNANDFLEITRCIK